MAFTRRRPNKLIVRFTGLGLGLGLLFGAWTAFLPADSRADIILYDPQVDISMSIYYPLFNEGDIAPNIRPGIYFGGYFSRRSRFFSDYFNSERVYTIFEAGVAVNPIENEDSLFITIPLHVNFAYRIGRGSKFSFLPFVGTGLNITYNDYLSNPQYNEIFRDRPYLGAVLALGFELRWPILKRSALRVKVDYGLVFDGRVTSGYTQFLRIRLPLPFIP
jgi:hypothetical protein